MLHYGFVLSPANPTRTQTVWTANSWCTKYNQPQTTVKLQYHSQHTYISTAQVIKESFFEPIKHHVKEELINYTIVRQMSNGFLWTEPSLISTPPLKV